MIKASEFASRRKQWMKQIGPTGIAILVAAPEIVRNGDVCFPYRQQSDFYYFTGFEEPESVAIFIPGRANGEFVLFNRPYDAKDAIWTGHRLGQADARNVLGVSIAYPIEELERRLPDLLAGRDTIHYTLGCFPATDALLLKAIDHIRGQIRSGNQAPFKMVDLTQTAHEMRVIKSPAEIALMRKAADISAKAHSRAMRFCKPGQYEYELEAEIAHAFQQQGARFVAYPSIVGHGANACILHYTQNDQVIADNSLVLIDAGCEYQQYASDITRTFPANGRFSLEQRAIYEIVLAAQCAGIRTVRPGVAWSAIQKVIVKMITRGLLELGILKGKLDDLIKSKAYEAFYMHSSGHWLGLDVHDVGCYKIKNQSRLLEPGMVLTVEPGIYMSATSMAPKRFRNIGIRIEDDVLVTSDGAEVLSQRAPKTVEAIEALMAQRK